MKGLAVILLSLVAVSCNKYGRRTTNRISDHPKCTLGNSDDFVMFRDDRDCGKFYECHRGTAFEFVCSEGQSFDLASRSCECSSIVDCSDGGISGSQDQPTPASDSASMPQARSTCNICRQAKESIPRHQNCPRTNGYYPVYFRSSKDCSQYYQCDQGTAYLIQCPAGLHFNTRINVCDYPQNVDCSGPVLAPPTDSKGSSGQGRTSPSCPICQHARNVIPKHPNCPRSNGYYPAYFRHPTDCSTFYQCDNGSAYEIQCPAGLHFNTLLSVCDYPAKTGCSVTSGGVQESTSHTNGHQGFDGSASRTNGHQGSDGSASRTNGHQGSAGAAFPTNGHQGVPGAVSQTNDHPKPGGSCNICRQAKESIPRHQNCPRTNGYYPVYFRNSKECSQYYQCDQGTAYLIQCPAGLHFNTRINVCDYPQNVDCSGPVLVSPTYPSSSSGEGRTSPSCPICQHARNVIPKHPNCPRSNGYYPAYFRHPTDCSTFYQCDNGSAYEIQCPAGLHFNTLLSVCDYPAKAGCSVTSGGVQESTSHTNGHQGFDGSASRTNGHQGSDGSASRTNGHQGSAGAVFPTNGHQGVPGAVSQTNDHPKPGGSCNICRQAKESIPRHQNCPRTNGYYPVYFRNSKECSQYYQCDQGTAYLIQCPAELYFNNRINVCDYPQNVDCSGPVLAPPTDSRSSSGEGRTSPSCPICQHARNVIPKHPNCPRSNGYYPAYFRHPTDCSTFYQCDNGSAYEIQCPAGLHFNTLLSVCDYPDKAGCSVTLGGVQESTSHTYGHQGFDGSASRTNGHQGSDGSVSRTNGHQGSAGAVFPTNGHQGVPGAVSQTNDHPKPGGSCNICRQAKESIPRHQNCPRTNGYYPVYFRNSKDCSQYYQCDQGTAYLIQCPAGLHFNTRINVCDYPQNVDCSGPVLVSPTYPSSSSGQGRTSPSCPICQHARNVIPKHPNCPRSNGYYPAYFRHPTDCSTFYQCDNGSAYEIQCPAGLHFNTLLSVCDYPAKAGCSPIQESTSHTNGHQGSDGSSFPTNEHQGSDGSVSRTNGHQGFDGSASRTNGHQGSDGAAFPTNGHQGFEGSVSRTNGHQGFDGSAFRTNGHQGSDGSTFRTNGHQGSDGYVSRTNGHQGPPGSVSQSNGHQGTDVGTSKVPTDDNEIHPQCPIITGKQVANYWANPRDCTKYYGCLWGCVEELSCPGGYRWHDGKKACVEERLVRC